MKKKILTTTFPGMLDSMHSMTILPWKSPKQMYQKMIPATIWGRHYTMCGVDYEIEKERLKFQKMLEDHPKLLYPGCEDGLKKLGTTLELLQWKMTNSVSNKGFGELLKLVEKCFLSTTNCLPQCMKPSSLFAL